MGTCGQIALVPGTLRLAGGGPRAQSALSLRHLTRVLRALHPRAHIRSVVQVTLQVFIQNLLTMVLWNRYMKHILQVNTYQRLVKMLFFVSQSVCYVTHGSAVSEARRQLERRTAGAIVQYAVVQALPRAAQVEWHAWAHTDNNRFECESGHCTCTPHQLQAPSCSTPWCRRCRGPRRWSGTPGRTPTTTGLSVSRDTAHVLHTSYRLRTIRAPSCSTPWCRRCRGPRRWSGTPGRTPTTTGLSVSRDTAHVLHTSYRLRTIRAPSCSTPWCRRCRGPRRWSGTPGRTPTTTGLSVSRDTAHVLHTSYRLRTIRAPSCSTPWCRRCRGPRRWSGTPGRTPTTTGLSVSRDTAHVLHTSYRLRTIMLEKRMALLVLELLPCSQNNKLAIHFVIRRHSIVLYKWIF